ncbi:hypothetical protein M6D93_18710 [Jatrophihabitans telluris]|uniref:Uncharacterized protein n=1 Tax=Jatrophihabitans telluris TaxID=2038343 RepID=A0ABY4QZK0_9ACTN|nr:hypothetical protein [Jatrophihabitans telluris]UQX88291.1 hypothetical protein M6D93_18710 [Jatrophihabitans telluris]
MPEPDPAPRRPASHGRPDRSSIERWLTGHGVPTFVIGYARPRRAVPWTVAGILFAELVITVPVVVGVGPAGVFPNLGVAVLAALVGSAAGYLALATGIVPLALFALRLLWQIVVRGGTSMMSVIPLLLVAVAFFFLGAETWQTVGRLHGLPLALTALLFAGIGIVFVGKQVRPDLDEIAFVGVDGLRAALPDELAVPDHLAERATAAPQPALGRAEAWNLRAVTALAQLTVAAVVGLLIFAFFIVFGVLTVDTATVTAWSIERAQVWWQARLAGHDYALSSEHVRVAAFLGVFSAFYFVVTASTDTAMRTSLTAGARSHARTCLAVRSVYRTALADPGRPPSPAAPPGA